MILNDKQTADDIQITIQNLKAASKKLDEDLEALQHNFLLKGYFRKKNKVQPQINNFDNYATTIYHAGNGA